MFSSAPNYTKLKTNLRLSVNRLKLIEKKKTELTQKARKEIADYLTIGKPERARIRVEHIIREDYLVEAMEIVEMYCDLLLTRFGLVTQMKELDEGIAEAVYSLVWVTPRLQSDIQELKVVSDVFSHKYGKPFAESARTATGDHHVSEKLMHKLAIQAPPKLLVEKYLIEIAKNYNIEYEPDPHVMLGDSPKPIGMDDFLIDLSERNNLGGGGGGERPGMPMQMGFIGYPQPPPLPQMPQPPTNTPFGYPPPHNNYHNNVGPGGPNIGGGGGAGGGGGGSASAPPFSYNIPPQPEQKDLNVNRQFLKDEKSDGASMPFDPPPPAYSSISPDDNFQMRHIQPPNASTDHPLPTYSMIVKQNQNVFGDSQNTSKPKPQPRSKMPPNMDFPNLPNVPSDMPDLPDPPKEDNDDIDFEDLSRRFEELKKKK